jgi:prepilin-type N-terminal cleavage/methylation domain-containing protein
VVEVRQIKKGSIAKNQGFTMVELAVVLVVVGLVIAGVFMGQQLIERAESSAISSEITDFQQAVSKFEETYNGIPGDIANATAHFAGAVNGDGDGVIEINNANGDDESQLFWAHLQASGLLPKQLQDFNAAAAVLQNPDLPIDEPAAYAVRQDPALGLVMDLTGASIGAGNATVTGSAVFTPQQALNLEEAFGDDGNPTTGHVRAIDGNNVAASSCVNGGAYATSTRPACVLTVVMQELPEDRTTKAEASAGGCGNIGDVRVDTARNCPNGFVANHPNNPGLKTGMPQVCAETGWEDEASGCETLVYADNSGQRREFGEQWSEACPAGYSGTITYRVGQDPVSRAAIREQVSDNCTSTYGACSQVGATSTRNCPAGMVGVVNVVCNGTVWVDDGDGMSNCTTPTCTHNSVTMNVGDTQNGVNCPVGWTGTQTATCIAEGVVVLVNDSCQPGGNGSCSTLGDTQDDPNGCPGGTTGSVTMECQDVSGSNLWVVTSNSCQVVQCGDDSVGTVRPTTESCPTGIVGEYSEYCDDNGVWTRFGCDSGNAMQCDSAAGGTDGNATWPTANYGDTTVQGTCIPGFTMGWGASFAGPARDCVDSGDGHSTVWTNLHVGRNSDGTDRCMQSCTAPTAPCGNGANCNVPASIHDQPQNGVVCPGGQWTVSATASDPPDFVCQDGAWVRNGGTDCMRNCWNGSGWTTHGTYQTRYRGSACGTCRRDRRRCNNGSFGGWSCYQNNGACPPPPPPPSPSCGCTCACSNGCSGNEAFYNGGSCCHTCCSNGWGGTYCASDRRLKDNVTLVGNHGGINLYEYQYVGDSKRYRGVMAQEVIHIPGAVMLDESGYFMVNYDVLGIQFGVID